MSDNHVPEALDGSTWDGWVSGDAMRWTPKLAAAHPADEYRAGWDAVTDQLYTTYDAMRRLHTDITLIAEGGPPEQPPTDPRERALWATKHRGTGPDRTPAGQARRPYGRRRR